jgi:hypothetical protein
VPIPQFRLPHASKGNLRDDEEGRQFPLMSKQEIIMHRVGANFHLRFQGVADPFLLAGDFEGSEHLIPDLQQPSPPVSQFFVQVLILRFREETKVDAGGIQGELGDLLPDLFGKEGKDGGNELHQGSQDLIEGGLGGAS